MGESFTVNGPITAQARVHGTAPIEKLVLMRGRDEVHVVQPDQFATAGASSRIRISWEGARIRGRARRATWNGKIQVNEARILKATTFAFDSPADGIVNQDESSIIFKSSTVGDVDGIDLFLEKGDSGFILFESKIGKLSLDLAELGPEQKVFVFGELGLKVRVQRYPEQLDLAPLSLEFSGELQIGKVNPFLIKAVQEDGQIAWSSPIYVTMSEPDK